MKKIIIILMYSILSVLFFSILANSEVLSHAYGLWLELYGDIPYFFQCSLIVLGGYLSTKTFAKLGAYSVEFDDDTLEKKQQKNLSVLRTSVLLSILIFITSHTYLHSFRDIILIFSLLYLGKLAAYPAYLNFYTKKIFAMPPFRKLITERECTPEKCLIEKPISTLSEDKYQREQVVTRLKGYLTGVPESGVIFRRIALVGSFGSGKSSVLNMLENQINIEQDKLDSKWLFVHFDAWGRTDNNGGVQGVLLESIINTISKVIETSSVQSIPSNYISALRNIHATTKFLPDLFDDKEPPIEQLSKLNTLLKENNCKVCVFIEDMDRNEEPRKAINSIAPLLNDFRNNCQISFIFTLGYNAESSDIVSRVTDYREDLFPIDIKSELIAFVSSQHNKAYENSIELFYENQSSSWLAEGGMYSSLNGMQTKSKDNVILLLNEVIATAREFSAIKREVESKWEWLQGEVNFDDLLIVTTLKVIDPIAYEFIFKNINKLQGEHSEEIGRELDERWSELPASMGRSENRESSKKLICYVFKSWTSSWHSIRPQSLSCKYSFKNFWEIYLRAGSIQAIDFSDQNIFNDMRRFNYNKNAESASFIDRMVGNVEFIEHIRNLYSYNKSNFDDDFWARILDKVQTKSTSIQWSLMASSGRELKDGNARNQCEALKLIHSLYIDKESEQYRLHIIWALNTSIYYFYYLCANSQCQSDLKDIFFQEITCDSKFYNLINGKDKGSALLFECLKLGCVSAEISDGFEVRPVANSFDVDLYKKILTWICCLSNTRSKIECYDALFYKYCNISPINASVSRLEEVFDLGVYELLTDENKLDICNIIDSEIGTDRNRLHKVRERINHELTIDTHS